MTYNVVLTAENGRFLAHVPELPHCTAEAESRDRALALIQQRLEDIARRSEVVKLEAPSLESSKHEESKPSAERNGSAQTHTPTATPPRLVQFPPMILAKDNSVHLETPWEYFGIFKDDPTWMPMFEEIERRRDQQKIPKAKKRRKR